MRRTMTVSLAGVLLAGSLMLGTPAFSQVTTSGAGAAITLGAASSKVPAGTYLTIAFNNQMDARITEAGEPFTATLTEDFLHNAGGYERVILPKGSIIRGRVSKINRPSFFSRGGAIYLDFDHVVLPSGELLPLDLNLSTTNTIVNKNGALYADPGIPAKLQKSVGRGVDTFENVVDMGFDVGRKAADGLGSIVTVPIAVAGGAVAGTLVTTGNAAVSVFGKGETVIINPGDTATIDFGGSFNLPAQ